MNRRLFFGIITTWILLEGAKAIPRVWAAQRTGGRGFLSTVADDVLEVTG